MKVKIKRLRKDAKIPMKGSVHSAGFDLCACLDKAYISV